MGCGRMAMFERDKSKKVGFMYNDHKISLVLIQKIGTNDTSNSIARRQ